VVDLDESTEKGGDPKVNPSSVRNSSVNSSPSKIEKTKLDCLLQEYKDILREKLQGGLPPKCLVDHVIVTSDHSPLREQAHKLKNC